MQAPLHTTRHLIISSIPNYFCLVTLWRIVFSWPTCLKSKPLCYGQWQHTKWLTPNSIWTMSLLLIPIQFPKCCNINSKFQNEINVIFKMDDIFYVLIFKCILKIRFCISYHCWYLKCQNTLKWHSDGVVTVVEGLFYVSL